MLVRTIVLLSVLCFIVQNSECRNDDKIKKVFGKFVGLFKNKTTTKPPRVSTARRPIPPIPTPRWKNLQCPSTNEGSGLVNPAGFGPRPLCLNTRGAVGLPHPKYTWRDTGNTSLGYFLGQSLSKVKGPSYHYYNTAYDPHGYLPRYDHYTVHHYYHNRGAIPSQATIYNTAIVVCAADSGSFCPLNTTSLCTNNGVVVCVAGDFSVVPCSFQVNDRFIGCIRTTVPCQGNYGPECLRNFNGKESILMPCISIVTKQSSRYDPGHKYCVVVAVLPAQKRVSEGERAIALAETIFSEFVVRVLGLKTF